MSSQETFQVSTDAAEVYESKFVPAIFGEWAPHLVEIAGVAPGQSVLDVACGTGAVAREAASRMGGTGRVVGLDLNEGMLAVARRLEPGIEWIQGDAADLPVPAGSFDRVLCQSALMFFPDRAQALREMARVVIPGGGVAVQVWGVLESQPGYGPFFNVALKHVGREAANLLTAYWALGDLDLVGSLFYAAGLDVTNTRNRMGTARFDSVDEVVRTEVNSTPLGERISEEAFDWILEESREVLKPFTTSTGKAEIPILGHLIVGRKR